MGVIAPTAPNHSAPTGVTAPIAPTGFIPLSLIFCIFMPTNSIFCFTFLTIWFIMGISADDEREFFFVSKRGIRQKSTLMIT